MLKTLGVHFIRHPCLTRKLRVLAPAAPKIIPRLLSGRKCSGMSNCGRWGRIVRNFWQALSRILAFAVVWVGASLRRLCATAIVHPLHVYERSVGFASCETLGVHFIRHPCLTRKLRVLPPAAPKIIPRLLSGRKCGGVVELRSLGSARPCADFVRPLSCILARPAQREFAPPAPKKQGYACLGIALLFWCRWRGSNPHGIATNGF